MSSTTLARTLIRVRQFIGAMDNQGENMERGTIERCMSVERVRHIAREGCCSDHFGPIEDVYTVRIGEREYVVKNDPQGRPTITLPASAKLPTDLVPLVTPTPEMIKLLEAVDAVLRDESWSNAPIHRLAQARARFT